MIYTKRILVIYFLISLNTFSQNNTVNVSGIIKDKNTKQPLAFVNVVLLSQIDSAFVTGVISADDGLFKLTNIKEGNYVLSISYIGYNSIKKPLLAGRLSNYLDIGIIELIEDTKTLTQVEIAAKQDEVNDKMDKKTFKVEDNVSQSGGSVLQTMQSLPGVTVQDGKVQLRGSDKIMVLIDGKQTALTGFGNQSGLDNIPASSIEKIEIINNPSAKFDANGNAGIINIIYKKNNQDGFNGKVALNAGLGALWIKKENLPTITAQYQNTPKVNPSLSLNYRKKKVNLFLQGDYVYNKTLNKNEFIQRTYANGDVINQQTKRNRTTTIGTAKVGLDWNVNDNNAFTISALFSSEKIVDKGEKPFFNSDLSQRNRLWTFLEDELKTTVTATAGYEHKYKQLGRKLNIGFNYTFHREDEKYFFENTLPTYMGLDSFKLISDEHVADFNLDYVRPLKYGKFETGAKFRRRVIPTNMKFIPGLNSPLDTNAGGWATYAETIPALYGTYIFENKKLEVEVGVRLEYVDLQYKVNPNHNTYQSNGYSYFQPFPNVRIGYKINSKNKLTAFYNRRVDRPNEVDIRIFPKYDDAEVIKIGNPALKPQYTNLVELGFKTNFKKGYFYTALYYKNAQNTIGRIASTDSSNLIYSIMQNAGKSLSTGLEIIFSYEFAKWYNINFNANTYYNQIDAFTVNNKYPSVNTFTVAQQNITTGNVKLNNNLKLNKTIDVQVIAIYLAPDIIPQGKIDSRFTLDFGIKKIIQKGKGEVFFNATDLLNTMVIKKEINGTSFKYTSNDYYETQVFRIGYSYKF